MFMDSEQLSIQFFKSCHIYLTGMPVDIPKGCCCVVLCCVAVSKNGYGQVTPTMVQGNSTEEGPPVHMDAGGYGHVHI